METYIFLLPSNVCPVASVFLYTPHRLCRVFPQVSELRNRFDPAAKAGGPGGHAAPRPVDMGKPTNTVTEITSIFEHKARSDRRRVRRGNFGEGGERGASVRGRQRLLLDAKLEETGTDVIACHPC